MAEEGAPRTASTPARILTPEDALEAGIRIGKKYKCIGIVIDADPLSPIICNAFIAGANSNGADIIHAGVCTTPAAIIALRDRCKCIVSVGSPTVVGAPCLSFFKPSGASFNELDLRVLDEPSGPLPGWADIGKVTYYSDSAVDYSEKVAEQNIRISGGVVLDCGCGASVTTAPTTLTQLGADISTFNGDFRGHKPRNPSAAIEDRGTFVKLVGLSIGTIGASMNGDGTHVDLLDEDGLRIDRDEVLALLLRYYEPRLAVIPFEAPAIVENAFESPLGLRNGGHGFESGRKLLRTLSDDETMEVCEQQGADFAVLRDGSFIFPRLSLCPDAVFATALLAELAGIRSLRHTKSEFEAYQSIEYNIPFDGSPRTLESRLADAVKKYKAGKLVASENGYAWKVIMEHGLYSIVPQDRETIRIKAESPDRIYLVTMMEQAKELVKSCLS